MNERRFVIKDAPWCRIEPLLPGKAGDRGVTARDNRLFPEAVVWRVRTGSPWRDLAKAPGSLNSRFKGFRRCTKTRLFTAISGDPDLECALIDETIAQAHRKATGAKGGLKIRPSGSRAAG